MRFLSRNKLVLVLALIILNFIASNLSYKIIRYYHKSYNSKLLSKTLAWELQKVDASPKPAVFSAPGIQDVALITMIKDEEDIIYENLVWHFAIGFRKFVIVDNASTDNTRTLINKFKKETKEKAQIIIIDDPITEYIQSAITTGSMKLAQHVWPEVKWVFPVDADEFWYPRRHLADILQSIPKNKNAIQTLQYNYFPTEKATEFDEKTPFYKTITCRKKFNQEQAIDKLIPKMAAKPGSEIIISQGNHFINRDKKSNNHEYTQYISGNMIGLDMLHFQRRSVSQVLKKYTNGAKANISGQQKGRIGREEGTHWTSFALEAEQKGSSKAAEDRFNEWVVQKDVCTIAPLPMQKAFELFQKIIAN